MKRRLIAVAAGALLQLGAAPARAQVAVYFQPLGDTATAGVPGQVTTVEVRARDSLGTTVQGANLTFYFDTAKVQILGVQALAGAGLDTIADTVRSARGYFLVEATGSVAGFDAPLYRLQLQLKAGATSGTYLWVKGDSVPSKVGNLQAVGSIAQVCHATEVWGDVSGDARVDSRDALIALSAAVGLPVTGFNLAVGDVDGDGLTNSRDALMMLSYAIALPITAPGARVAAGIPDACPGLTAPGDSVVFQRLDAPAGLYALGAASTVPVAIAGATSTSPDANARLAADGKSVVYVCPGSGGYQVCRINVDGSGFVQLTADTLTTASSPDWSPSGDSIVYLSNSAIWRIAADGSGKSQFLNVQGAPFLATEVKWGRDSTLLAYAGIDGALHTVRTDGSSDAVVATGFTDIGGMRWSPAGDSIAFVRRTDPRLWVVPVTGGTPGIVFGFAGNIIGGDWSAAGILISLNTGTAAPSIWFSKGVNQAVFRVTRPASGDRSPTWRRSP